MRTVNSTTLVSEIPWKRLFNWKREGKTNIKLRVKNNHRESTRSVYKDKDSNFFIYKNRHYKNRGPNRIYLWEFD